MTTVPHPNPIYARQGVRVPRAPLPTQSLPPSPRVGSTQPLIHELPELFTFTCGFTGFFVPDSAALNTPDVVPTMFLGRLRPATLGVELLLHSLTFECVSADVSGHLPDGGDVSNAWGDRAGIGPTIMVGDRVITDIDHGDRYVYPYRPLALGPSRQIDLSDPSVYLSGFADDVPPTTRLLFQHKWALGDFRDTQPLSLSVTKSFGASGYRFGMDQEVQVLMQFAKGSFPEGGDRECVGFGRVQLHFMRANNIGQFVADTQ